MGTPTPCRHLLVRLPNPLGDAVLATPALRALRRAIPRARITWLGGPAALAALDGLAERDGVVPVAGTHARGLLAPFRAGRFWRGLRPDAVLLLTHSFSSALAARLSRAPHRVGAALHGRRRLLTTVVALPRRGRRLAPRPMVRGYLDLVAPFGAVDDGLGPRVRVTGYDRRRASARLVGWGREGALVAVNPGASFGPTKVYPSRLLAEAIRLARREAPLSVLVLAGPGEEGLAAEVASRIAAPVRSCHERPPDVGELKGLLDASDVFLGADSGPRHLAEALGVPSVVWMGPTDPRWTADRPATVLRREELSCLGCHRRRCPIGHVCMEELDPAAVAASLVAAARVGRINARRGG